MKNKKIIEGKIKWMEEVDRKKEWLNEWMNEWNTDITSATIASSVSGAVMRFSGLKSGPFYNKLNKIFFTETH